MDRRRTPPPSLRQRWAALAGQQQAVLVLTTIAVILLALILLVVLVGGDDDDDDAAVAPTATAIATPDEPDPTPTPEPEPSPTPEPEPTNTPEPTATEEPTATPEPTATEEPSTPEPDPTETSVPEPTETPVPEPTPTPEPEPTPPPVSGEVEVDDPENDVVAPDGTPPDEPLAVVDLREVNLELTGDDDNELRVRFTVGEDVLGSVDDGTALTWALILWVEDEEQYRLEATLEGDAWQMLLVDLVNDEEIELDGDPDVDGDELEITLSRDLIERITGTFTWAAWARHVSGDGAIFGDNLPDAGDVFVEMPEPNQREPFPE